MKKSSSLLVTVGLLVVSLMLSSTFVFAHTDFSGTGSGQGSGGIYPFHEWSGTYDDASNPNIFYGTWFDITSGTSGTFYAAVGAGGFSGHWLLDGAVDTMGHISGSISSTSVYGGWNCPKVNPTYSGSFWSTEYNQY